MNSGCKLDSSMIITNQKRYPITPIDIYRDGNEQSWRRRRGWWWRDSSRPSLLSGFFGWFARPACCYCIFFRFSLSADENRMDGPWTNESVYMVNLGFSCVLWKNTCFGRICLQLDFSEAWNIMIHSITLLFLYFMIV